METRFSPRGSREIKNKQKIEDFEMKIDIYIDILTVGIDSAGNFTAIRTLTLFLIFFSRLRIIKIKKVQFSHLKYTGKNAFPRARLNDRKKFFFFLQFNF